MTKLSRFLALVYIRVLLLTMLLVGTCMECVDCWVECCAVGAYCHVHQGRVRLKKSYQGMLTC